MTTDDTDFTAETSPHDVGLGRLNDFRFELLRERFRNMERREESLKTALAEVQRLSLPSLVSLEPEQKTDALWNNYDDILCRNEPLCPAEDRKATVDALQLRVPDDSMRFILTSILAHYNIHPGHPMTTIGREYMIDRLVLADEALEWWFPYELVASMQPPPEPKVTDVVVTTPREETFDAVPVGKIDDIMKWVGDDGEKARLAARAEATRKGAKSRKGLLKKLTVVSEADPELPEDIVVGEMVACYVPTAEVSTTLGPVGLTVIEGGGGDLIPDGTRLVIAVDPDGEVTHSGVVAAELVDGLLS